MSYFTPELMQGSSVICYTKQDWNFLSGSAVETCKDKHSTVFLDKYNKSRQK